MVDLSDYDPRNWFSSDDGGSDGGSSGGSDGGSSGSWIEEAKEFFADPAGSVIEIVATWILSGIISLFQSLIAIGVTIVETLLIPIFVLSETIADVIGRIGSVWLNVVSVFDNLFVTIIEASGPLALPVTAVLIFATLLAMGIVVRTAIRVIPIT